jgi:hypothetical protein
VSSAATLVAGAARAAIWRSSCDGLAELVGDAQLFEPSGTLTTGDRHEGDIPAHVDSTAGHDVSA